MIISGIFYAVKCDRCGVIAGDDEYSWLSTDSEALENAINSEWLEKDNKHYCPSCYHVDDSDNEVVNPEWPKELKQVQTFIEKVLNRRAIVEEYENNKTFTIKFHDYANPLTPITEDSINWMTKILSKYEPIVEKQERSGISNTYIITINREI